MWHFVVSVGALFSSLVSRKTQRKRTHRANAEDTNEGADVGR